MRMGLFDRPGLLTRGVTDEQTEESTHPLSTDDGDHERF